MSGFTFPRVDTGAAAAHAASVTIGQTVEYDGRDYRLRGFAPFGVRNEHVELEDLRTGEWISVPLELVESAVPLSPEGVSA